MEQNLQLKLPIQNGSKLDIIPLRITDLVNTPQSVAHKIQKNNENKPFNQQPTSHFPNSTKNNTNNLKRLNNLNQQQNHNTDMTMTFLNQTFFNETQANSSNNNYDYKWFKNKIDVMCPYNSLKEKATIEWFRKRKSQDTHEKYLHSGEELSQKQHVHRVVKELQSLKKRLKYHQNIQFKEQQRQASAFVDYSNTIINQDYVQTKLPQNQSQHDKTEIQTNRNNQINRLLNMTDASQTLQWDNNVLKDRLSTLRNDSISPRFKRQISEQGHNHQRYKSQRVSPIKSHFKRIIEANQKSVEINDEAMMSSRLIESKMKRYQRSTIHNRIKYPVNEKEAKQCVKQFVQLFKNDCKSALEESNEFFQMKKIQLKSTLAKLTNPFNLETINKDSEQSYQQQSNIKVDLIQQNLNKHNSKYILQNQNKNSKRLASLHLNKPAQQFEKINTKQIDKIKKIHELENSGKRLKDIPRNEKDLLDEMQSQLKYHMNPKEIQYLQKIEKIIQNSKTNAMSSIRSQNQSFQASNNQSIIK